MVHSGFGLLVVSLFIPILFTVCILSFLSDTYLFLTLEIFPLSQYGGNLASCC